MIAAPLINTERSYLGKGLTTGAQDIHQTHAHHDLLGRDFHFRADAGGACPFFYSRFFALCNGGHNLADRALSTKRSIADFTKASFPADYLLEPHGCIQL